MFRTGMDMSVIIIPAKILSPHSKGLNFSWSCESFILTPMSRGTLFKQIEPCVWVCSFQIWFGEDWLGSQGADPSLLIKPKGNSTIFRKSLSRCFAHFAEYKMYIGIVEAADGPASWRKSARG
jgi:hypothetical protein